MTAPLFLVPSGTLEDAAVSTTVRLDGPEGRHAADVQRVAVGEQVLLSDGQGLVAGCTVLTTGRGLLELHVDELTAAPEPVPRVVLVQALAKGERDLQAVEAATELDVDEIVPWQADRCIVRWRGDRATKAHARWQNAARAASKQSRRSRVPTVASLVTRTTLVERVRHAALALVLHESAEEPLAGVGMSEGSEVQQGDEVLLVVGPEGGISPEELTALTGAGARAVRLGRTVLRTSTAGPAALAVLNARGRW